MQALKSLELDGRLAAGETDQRLCGADQGWLLPQAWRLESGLFSSAVFNSASFNDEAGLAVAGASPAAGAMACSAEADAPPLLLLLDRRAAELPTASRQRLQTCLSPAERLRHEAFRLPADRERFLLGRAGLRLLLGAWLQLAPEAVPLEPGAHGKPICPIGPRFNLSHSGDLILLALHATRPVGVDVERLRPDLAWPALARRLFSQTERLALERCPAAERPEAALATWCRLEARLKARGTGLAGLKRLRLEEMQESRARLEAHHHRIEAASTAPERLWNVRVPAGYRAAVALARGGGVPP